VVKISKIAFLTSFSRISPRVVGDQTVAVEVPADACTIVGVSILIKKKRKFSSYTGNSEWSFLIFEEMLKYFPIYEEVVSHI
jgi:hypothetical protein